MLWRRLIAAGSLFLCVVVAGLLIATYSYAQRVRIERKFEEEKFQQRQVQPDGLRERKREETQRALDPGGKALDPKGDVDLMPSFKKPSLDEQEKQSARAGAHMRQHALHPHGHLRNCDESADPECTKLEEGYLKYLESPGEPSGAQWLRQPEQPPDSPHPAGKPESSDD
jgi:hypothetical protein